MAGSVVARVPIESIEFVKELYPRIREDDAAIERYREAIDRLPPIVIARGHILVDGFHRWQAHKRENLSEIAAEDLGNLSDVEILRESISRNASHGHQLSQKDKSRLAGELWIKHFASFPNGERISEIMQLLSVSQATVERWTKDARKAEKDAQKAKAWDLWLDCCSYRDIGEQLGVAHTTIEDWCVAKTADADFTTPPASRQHFNIWQFQKANGESSYFGRMPPQVVENLLWFYTNPSDIVVDLFAGGGTTIDVAKAMGRRVWASDIKPSTPNLPIHQHNVDNGWPEAAPSKAKLIILDPPYWQQAKGRYSDSPEDWANLTLDEFYSRWERLLGVCAGRLAEGGRIAYIISSTEIAENAVAIDHATDMIDSARRLNLRVHRRIIVPYQTQQATGAQVEWARENKRMLNLYRDLVVLG